VFIGIAILTNLFSSADLPVQISGALLEAVVTALITYFLLAGQTGQEEMKERNVKVFEEKSERFNRFIDKLWEIWEDRSVSLEELNELIKFVSKEIVMYSKPETVDKILKHLIDIAEYAKPDKTDSSSSETTALIQQNIFNIINALAKEIGLGGEINTEIRKKLNLLESKVVPYLIQRDFKKKFIENFKNTLSEDEYTDFTQIEYRADNCLYCQIKNSSVYLKIGSLERKPEQKIFFGFAILGNGQYNTYRDATKGWRKWFLKGGWWFFENSEFINFADYENLEQKYREFNDADYKNKLGEKAIELYKKWQVNGKNIEAVIEECEK
jgi:hypothetical protein